jgi:hypothetical protein
MVVMIDRAARIQNHIRANHGSRIDDHPCADHRAGANRHAGGKCGARMAGYNKILAALQEIEEETAPDRIVANGDDEAIMLNLVNPAESANHRSLQQPQAVTLWRVVKVSGDVYVLTGSAHGKEHVGHDLGMAPSAHNQNTHRAANFP